MSGTRPVKILVIDDSEESIRLVRVALDRYEAAKFQVLTCDNGAAALQILEREKDVDLILMDYYLPGSNGLDVTRQIQQRGIAVPIVFLSVAKDIDLVLEIMKHGVKDYILKEDIMSHVFPQTLVKVHERTRLQNEMQELETRRSRLEAMQEMVMSITTEITDPLQRMKDIVHSLEDHPIEERSKKYLGLMLDNIQRIEGKIEKLKNLKDDKTVQYIKDIRMIDLS